jgi:hypothetical protein
MMNSLCSPIGQTLLRASLLCAGLASLSSCSNNAVGVPEYFPLNTGWKWQYEMITTTNAGKANEEYTVENLGFKNYGDGIEGWERRNSIGNFYLFRTDGAGIYRIAVRNEIEDQMRPDAEKPRRFVLKEPLTKGTAWQVPSVPYLMKKAFDWPYELKFSHPITLLYEIDAIDTSITVKAGEFKHCMAVTARHQLRVYIDPVAGFQEIAVSQKEWYCKGVGLVKLVRDEPVVKSNFYFGGSQSFELVSWSR